MNKKMKYCDMDLEHLIPKREEMHYSLLFLYQMNTKYSNKHLSKSQNYSADFDTKFPEVCFCSNSSVTVYLFLNQI